MLPLQRVPQVKRSSDEGEDVYLQEVFCHPGMKQGPVAWGHSRNGLPDSHCAKSAQGSSQEAAGQGMFSSPNVFIISDIFLKANDLYGVKASIPVSQDQDSAGRSKGQICWHCVAPLQRRE